MTGILELKTGGDRQYQEVLIQLIVQPVTVEKAVCRRNIKNEDSRNRKGENHYV